MRQAGVCGTDSRGSQFHHGDQQSQRGRQFRGHSEEKVETSVVGMGLRVVELGALSTLTFPSASIDLQGSIWVPERPQRTG